jgi:hypothetical protein
VPGPASLRFGAPVSLEGVASVPEGTDLLRAAVLDLARNGRAAETPAAQTIAAAQTS